VAVTQGLDGVKVLVVDVGVDAVLRRNPDDTRVLILNPHQPRTEAVDALRRVLPFLSPRKAEQVVDRYLPDQAPPPSPPWWRRDPWWRWVARAVVLVVVAGLAYQAGRETPPLHRGDVQQVLVMAGVQCDSNNGWHASCVGELSGAHTIDAWSSPSGVFLHVQSGRDVVGILVAGGRVEACEQAADFMSRGWLSVDGAAAVWLQSDTADVFVWGAPAVMAAAVPRLEELLAASQVQQQPLPSLCPVA
jgi:hypothetical protein